MLEIVDGDLADFRKRKRGTNRLLGIVGAGVKQCQYALFGEIAGDLHTLGQQQIPRLIAGYPGSRQRNDEGEKDYGQGDGQEQLAPKAGRFGKGGDFRRPAAHVLAVGENQGKAPALVGGVEHPQMRGGTQIYGDLQVV